MGLRPFGATGLMVSPLGLGTVKFGRERGVKYPTAFQLPDDGAIDHLLDTAAGLGINLLDTAPAYGSAEERLGRALRRRREDWVVCTKAGEEFDGEISRFDFSAKAIRASVERSLRRLGRERLDLVALHSDGLDEGEARFGAAADALLALKDRGLVAACGFSGKTLAGGLWAVGRLDAVMVTCNPSHRDELPVIAAAAAAGRGVLVKKALASGHLDFPGSGDPIARAMEFVFAQPGVGCVVVGTLNPAHLEADMRAAMAAIRRPAGGG